MSKLPLLKFGGDVETPNLLLNFFRLKTLFIVSVTYIPIHDPIFLHIPGGGNYFIGYLCVIITLLSIAAMLYMLFHQRHHINQSTIAAHLNLSRNLDEEKSNNLQNEENLRRYTSNPLKEGHAELSLSSSLSEISPRISVVRPLSSASSVEMLEMMCEMQQHQHRTDNKLYKSQNNLCKNNFLINNNTSAVAGEHHKSFKNINNVVQQQNRSLQPKENSGSRPSSGEDDEFKKKSSPDVLTVLVWILLAFTNM